MYRYFDGKVLHPFGYGLTYTTFAYENYKCFQKTTVCCRSLDVRNTGDTASDEVVRRFRLESCVKKPICQLLDFVCVKTLPWQTRHVALEIPVESQFLRCFHQPQTDGRRGTYEIYAGASCMIKLFHRNLYSGGKGEYAI